MPDPPIPTGGFAVCALEEVVIPPTSGAHIRTGIGFRLPKGIVAKIFDPSYDKGKHPFTITNFKGKVLDGSFDEELVVAVVNLTAQNLRVPKGTCIARVGVAWTESRPDVDVSPASSCGEESEGEELFKPKQHRQAFPAVGSASVPIAAPGSVPVEILENTALEYSDGEGESAVVEAAPNGALPSSTGESSDNPAVVPPPPLPSADLTLRQRIRSRHHLLDHAEPEPKPPFSLV